VVSPHYCIIVVIAIIAIIAIIDDCIWFDIGSR
jgi:hypothetical protein